MVERKPRLEGKVAIVAGAGSQGQIMGNGKATAILMAREGASVLLVDAVEDRAAETLDAIAAEGGTASVFAGDVTNAADCQAMVEQAVASYGRLDILHNNVGIGGAGTVLEVTEEVWDRVMAVNVKSMMLTSKCAIPHMVAGGGGAITNVSSISAVRPRGLTAYSVSKGGVIALTQAMAIDHAKDLVRVNCIMPGPVYTSMVAVNMTEERRDARRRASPLQVEGTAWDIGWAGVYLASDEARWVTGVILPVDGGVTIASPSR
ncbi:MAG: short-chain dehydrogenase [Chloroflexi bacterium]|jgi:NAD(P)-dependent dehydrogenase (short-subunit alcohol dehydrogenase family)|nr:short-chain dehydrogenase [Chloroflexota bacterium]MDP6419785.1 glucose 1-dehydrogenase [SAR202 cluster bacterium]MDP6798424.1 glucose 1-dehydrogenase [SAR202 cluster bacterium]MQG56825.1 glucose 1-dehydrogenase [SAR202 cluster bacterium]HAL49732.1 short-chain dehydrogenase [Dehalococcoidia bacterium]|tara:strand:- start:719 stop:1504 length:786 start_codon:yes stop_codon:yes gene_type:complete